MNELKKSKVVFDPIEHTYTLGKKELQGITSTIIRWLFPYHKPESYSEEQWQEVLSKAAERGSAIHAEIENYNEYGLQPTSREAKDYVRLIAEKGLVPVAGEYLVSDEKRFASSIDNVYRGEEENHFVISDTKCTSEIKMPNLIAQLSIYKAWFEKQNKGCIVDKCYVVWLPKEIYHKESQMVEVQTLDAKAVKDILDTWIESPTEEAAEEIRSKYFGITKEVAHIPNEVTVAVDAFFKSEMVMKEVKEQQEEMKRTLKEYMEKNGIKSIKDPNGKWSVTYIDGSIRETFDSKKFKDEHSDMYSEYVKKSKTASSIRININDK